MSFGVPSPAVAMTKLAEARVFTLKAGDEDVLVTLGGEGKRIQAFDPVLDGQILSFAHAGDGLMRDGATGSSWDLVTGVCSLGKLKDKKLDLRPGTVSYEKAWRAFHPEGKIYR